jgi:hypothetical protein
MEMAAAIERFTAVARERDMVPGDLLEHTLEAFVRAKVR